MDKYINRKRLNSFTKLTYGVYTILGFLLIMIIIIMIIGIDEGEPHMIVVSVILSIIIIAELIAYILISRKFGRARRYAPIFEEDHDGRITFKRINEMTGYGLGKIEKDIDWMIKTGVLKNVFVDGDTVILWNETDFLDITCPTCGAQNTVRFGSSNKCKHCGSYLRRV